MTTIYVHTYNSSAKFYDVYTCDIFVYSYNNKQWQAFAPGSTCP